MTLRNFIKGIVNATRNRFYSTVDKFTGKSGEETDRHQSIPSLRGETKRDRLKRGEDVSKPTDTFVIPDKFTTFRSQILYDPSIKRYIDQRTKKFVSRADMLKRLGAFRYKVILTTLKQRKKDLNNDEIKAIADKFLSRFEELQRLKREARTSQELLDLQEEIDDLRDDFSP